MPKTTPSLKVAGRSDVGQRRKENQDHLGWRLSEDDGLAFALVADGLGGHPGGRRASHLAIDAALQTGTPDAEAWEAAEAYLRRAMDAAQRAVLSTQRQEPEHAEMATTLVAVLADAECFHLANIGDSRCYLLNGDGLQQLSRDETVAQQMVEDGTLRPEQRDHVPYAHILTRAVGTEPDIEPALSSHDWQPGDRLLLCSDGLNAALSEEKIAAELGSGDIETAAQRLTDLSNAAGAPDNVTVLIIEADNR